MDEAVSGSEEQQIKVLQCCMPLLTHFPLLTGVPLLRLLLVTIKLYDAEAPMVHHTAAATIRQIVVWLFERDPLRDRRKGTLAASALLPPVLVKLAPLGAPGTDSPTDCEMEAFEADAFIVMQDLCLLLGGEAALALGIPRLATGLALEVMESILAEYPRLVRERPRLMDLIRGRVCTLCIRRFAERAPFPEQCRLWRLVLVLIRNYHDLLPIECEMFATMLSRLLTPGETTELADWELALMVESMAEVLGDAPLLQTCQTTAQAAGVGFGLASIIQWLNDLAGLIVGALEAGPRSPTLSPMVTLKVPLLGQFDKAQAPSLPPLYSQHLALSILHRWLSLAASDEREVLGAIWERVLAALLRLLERDYWPEMSRETAYLLLQRLARAPLPLPLDGCIRALVEADPWGLLRLAIEEGEQLSNSWLPLLRVIHALDGSDRVEEWTASTPQLSDPCYAQLQEAMTVLLVDTPTLIPRIRLVASLNLERPSPFAPLFTALAAWLAVGDGKARAQASQALTSFTLGGLACKSDKGEDAWLLPLVLMAKSGYEDVNRLCLECLGRVLERHELHAAGWQSVLEVLGLLLRVEAVSLAILRTCFALLKVICTDHLAVLPIDSCLVPLVDLLSIIAEQRGDLNVALTAIGLMWDVSDHLKGRRGEAEGQEEAMHKAWLHLLAKLAQLTGAQEERAEVRSSAVATLCRCIQSCAGSLQPTQFDELISTLWLPLLQTQGEEQTPAETRIQLLNGITGLLSLHLNRMGPNFWAALWPQLLEACLAWVKAGLVDCGVASFAALLEAAMSIEGDKRQVGEAPFIIWQQCAAAAMNNFEGEEGVRFSQSALLKLVQLQQWLPQRERDPHGCLTVLRMALRHPLWEGPVRDVQECSELQSACLRMLMLLERNGQLVMGELAAWIQLPLEPAISASGTVSPAVSGTSPRLSYAKAILSQQPLASLPPPPPCTFVALSLRAMDLLTGLWRRHYVAEEGPLADSLRALGLFMAAKYEAPRQLWRRATQAWMEITRLTLGHPAGEHASAAVGLAQVVPIHLGRLQLLVRPWRDSLEASVQLSTIDQIDLQDDEQFDLDTLLTFPLHDLLPKLPTELQAEFIQVLAECSLLYRPASDMPMALGWLAPVKIVRKRRLAMGCLQALVDLLQQKDDPQLAELALPCLLNRLRVVVDNYTRDRQQLGSIPFPLVREQEMRYSLQTLVSLRLSAPHDPLYHLRVLKDSLAAALIVLRRNEQLCELLQSCILAL